MFLEHCSRDQRKPNFRHIIRNFVCRNDSYSSPCPGAPDETSQRGSLAGEGLFRSVLHQHVILLRLLVRLSYLQLSLACSLPIYLHVRSRILDLLDQELILNRQIVK